MNNQIFKFKKKLVLIHNKLLLRKVLIEIKMNTLNRNKLG